MARDEVQGDMCNLDKYLAAIRRQVELIAEFELTKNPSPKRTGDKKPLLKIVASPRRTTMRPRATSTTRRPGQEGGQQEEAMLHVQARSMQVGRQVPVQARP